MKKSVGYFLPSQFFIWLISFHHCEAQKNMFMKTVIFGNNVQSFAQLIVLGIIFEHFCSLDVLKKCFNIEFVKRVNL